MFFDWNIEYCLDVNCLLTNLGTKNNLSHNHSRFCNRNQQIDLKIYMEMQRT